MKWEWLSWTLIRVGGGCCAGDDSYIGTNLQCTIMSQSGTQRTLLDVVLPMKSHAGPRKHPVRWGAQLGLGLTGRDSSGSAPSRGCCGGAGATAPACDSAVVAGQHPGRVALAPAALLLAAELRFGGHVGAAAAGAGAGAWTGAGLSRAGRGTGGGAAAGSAAARAGALGCKPCPL